MDENIQSHDNSIGGFEDMFRALISGLFVFVIVSFPVQATTLIPIDLPELHRQASHIVFAECINNQVEIDTQTNMVVTYTTFAVIEHIKGNREQTFTIKQAGGNMPNNSASFSIPGVPSFRQNEKYLLFIPPKSQLGFSSPVGLIQGAFQTTEDNEGNMYVSNGRLISELMSGMQKPALPDAAATAAEKAVSGSPAGSHRMRLTDMLNVLKQMP